MITNAEQITQDEYFDLPRKKQIEYNLFLLNSGKINYDEYGNATNLEVKPNRLTKEYYRIDLLEPSHICYYHIKPEPTPEEEFKAYCQENKFEVGKEIIYDGKKGKIKKINNNDKSIELLMDAGALYYVCGTRIYDIKLYEPKYCAFETFDEVSPYIGKVLKHKEGKNSHLITSIFDGDMLSIGFGGSDMPVCTAFENYDVINLENGERSPFGKEV